MPTTVQRDTARHDVDVLVLGARMPRHHVLVGVQPHAGQIQGLDLSPLVIGQLLARRRRQLHAQHRLAQTRPQPPDLAELGRQFPRRGPRHVAIQNPTLLLAKGDRREIGGATAVGYSALVL